MPRADVRGLHVDVSAPETGRVNDKIILLTDTDGQADRSTVFADGLNIPTGLETANGEVSDSRPTCFSCVTRTGRRGGRAKAGARRFRHRRHAPGDELVRGVGWRAVFLQGDGIESRVETPWGVSSLYRAGVYRLRPGRLELHGLLDDFMGPGNRGAWCSMTGASRSWSTEPAA